MQTYENTLHRNLSISGSVLNYVKIPTPVDAAFDDIISEAGRDYGINAKGMVAKAQAEIVAEAVSKITGKPFAFLNASFQRSLLSEMLEGDKPIHGNGNGFIIGNVETEDLPSIKQAIAHYTGFDFAKILLESAQFLYEKKPTIVPLLTAENMHEPFIEWGKHLVSVYLSVIMICENADDVLYEDKELSDIMAANLRKRLNLEQVSNI